MRITRTISLAAGAAVLAFLAACGSSSSPSPSGDASGSPAGTESLTIGIAETELPALPNAIPELAETLGYYEKEGLKVTVKRLNGSPQLITALQAGSVDVANIGTSDLLTVDAKKLLSLKAVNSSQTDLSFLIASKTDIASPADLEGATFAIASPGSLDDSLSRIVLQAKGVDLSKIKFVPVGNPSSRAAALQAGKVDATTMSISTFSVLAGLTTIHQLVAPPEYLQAAPIVSKVNAATAATISSKGTAIQKMVTAQMKLARDFAADPSKWVAAVAKERSDLKAADLTALTSSFTASWCVNGCLNADSLAKTEDFQYATDDFKGLPKVAYADWVDDSFVARAVKDLGAASGGDPR